MQKRFASLIATLFLVSLFFLTSGSGNVLAEMKTLKLGAMAPLSGAAAPVGQGWINAIHLAVDEINQKGGFPKNFFYYF